MQCELIVAFYFKSRWPKCPHFEIRTNTRKQCLLFKIKILFGHQNQSSRAAYRDASSRILFESRATRVHWLLSRVKLFCDLTFEPIESTLSWAWLSSSTSRASRVGLSRSCQVEPLVSSWAGRVELSCPHRVEPLTSSWAARFKLSQRLDPYLAAKSI